MSVYVTQAQVEEWAQVTSTDMNKSADEWTALLTNLITRSSGKINTFTRRNFDLHTSTGDDAETFSVGPIDRNLVEVNGPIITLNTVKFRTTKGATLSTVDSDHYSFENYDIGNKADLIRIQMGTEDLRLQRQGAYPNAYTSLQRRRWRAEWAAGYENIVVDYSWGFAAVPADIQEVCIDYVAMLLQHMKRSHGKRIGTTKNFQSGDPAGPPDFTDDHKLVLNYYKSIAGGPQLL